MMSQLQQLTAALNGFDVLGAIALRSAVLLGIAALVMLLLRRASAAVRHLVWAVAVTGVLVMPLMSLVMPAWRVLPSRAQATPVESVEPSQPVMQATLTSSATVIEGSPRLDAKNAGIPALAEKPALQLSREQIALLAWLAGVLLTLSVVALGFMRVALMAKRARRTTDGVVLSTIAEVSAQLKVGSVLALEAGDAAMPMTWGLLQPKLLLPATARHWPQAKLRAVLRHELAHVRRRDSFWQLVAELVCAMHWFNPLAWYAARQMRIEREHACDDEVLNGGSRASDYATELLDIARSLRSARATSLAAIAMAQPSQLEGRLLAVLDEKRARHALTRRWPAWLAAVVVVGPVAGASSRAPSEKPPAEKRPVVAPPSRAAVPFSQSATARSSKPAPRVAVTLQQAQEPCSNDDRGSASISSHSNDDVQDVKWEVGGCKGRITSSGKIRFSGDLTGIESISSDGDFRLSVNDGRDVRVVTARPSGNTIAYEYTVDGSKRPWNPEGRAWFAAIMTYVVRRTGFAADERIDYLLKQQGPSAVLAEVDRMSSDYVQRLYLQKLIDKTQLNGAALESVLATAKRGIQSDYEMAELLIAVANKYEFTEGVRRAFIDATTTLQSDYEHRRALSAVLKKGGLSSENVAAMLTSSQAIESNYERAELLLSVLNKYKLDPAMRSAYLASASKLNSDYEKGRVLKGLLEQGAATGAEAADVLEAVVAMSSDHERSDVLRLLPPASLANAEVQTAYLKAITQMNSDYEIRRSLSEMVESGRLTGGGLNMTLNAASKMRSDYERAELLLAVIKAYRLNESQRQGVIVAADGMKSDYERGRVSSALVRQLAAPPPPPEKRN